LFFGGKELKRNYFFFFFFFFFFVGSAVAARAEAPVVLAVAPRASAVPLL